MSGSAAFLDPDICTVPESVCGQEILSIVRGASIMKNETKIKDILYLVGFFANNTEFYNE
jgi:hypothetical protein